MALLALTLSVKFLQLELRDGAVEFSLAERVLRGERLYRDINLHIMPLSVYWNVLLLEIMPRSMVTVSAGLLVSCVVLGLLFARIVFREARRDRTLTALLFVTLMYMGVAHWPWSGYSWNATLSLALAVTLLTSGRRQTTESPAVSATRLFGTGIMLGLTIGFKYPVGLLVIIAVSVWLVYDENLRASRRLGSVLARVGVLAIGAGVVPAAVLFSLYRRGQLAAFVEVVQDRLRQYARSNNSISFFDNFTPPNSFWNVPGWILEQAILAVLIVGFFATIAIGIALIGARVRLWRAPDGLVTADKECNLMLWSMLYLASFASIFPRADYPHVALALPLCLTALAVLSSRFLLKHDSERGRARFRNMAVVAVILFNVVMVGTVGKVVLGLTNGSVVILREYPATGMLLRTETATFIDAVKHAVDAGVRTDEPLLIADPTGCFLYSFLGRRPPTSIPYFYEPMLSEGDLAELVTKIRSGAIRALFVRTPRSRNQGAVAHLYEEASHIMLLKAEVGDFQLLVRR